VQDFNPLLLLSQEDLQTLSKEVRDSANLVNRRVVVFLFRPDLHISPAEWPCPRVAEGTAGCRRRFFVDSKARLTPGPERRRHFGPTDETFGCRFYDRLAATSPCEQILRMYKIRLFDPYATPLPNAAYTVFDGQRTVTGSTDEDAYATIRDLKVPAEVTVTWDDPRAEGTHYTLNIHVAIDGDDDDAARLRLHNLGYERWEDLADNVRDFQLNHFDRFPDMNRKGELDPATRAALRQVNQECDPSERPRGTEDGAGSEKK
jgi:hypothetical protein